MHEDVAPGDLHVTPVEVGFVSKPLAKPELPLEAVEKLLLVFGLHCHVEVVDLNQDHRLDAALHWLVHVLPHIEAWVQERLSEAQLLAQVLLDGLGPTHRGVFEPVHRHRSSTKSPDSASIPAHGSANSLPAALASFFFPWQNAEVTSPKTTDSPRLRAACVGEKVFRSGPPQYTPSGLVRRVSVGSARALSPGVPPRSARRARLSEHTPPHTCRIGRSLPVPAGHRDHSLPAARSCHSRHLLCTPLWA